MASGVLRCVPGLLFTMLLAVVNPVAAATPALLTDLALVDTLRSGGYNIYFRHVSTDWSQSDNLRQADDWLSCDPQQMRQLSGAGRADAAAIGESIRKLEIPVSEILASPYCRTVETARLMKLGQVTTSTAVMNLRAAEYFGGREAIVATAQALLATPPPAGGNRVIVAHGNVASAATPAYPAEGEGLVFKPEDDGSFILVGRVEPGQWAELLAAVAD